jgi:hypothetical protein
MSQNAFACSCSYHTTISNPVYPSKHELAAHLHTVQRASKVASLTFLGPHLLETPILNKYGLAINTWHKLLLCLSCGIAVIPSQLKSHLSKDHIKYSDTNKKAIVCLSTACGVDLKTLPELHLSTSIPAIKGLPIYKGHPCPSCHTVRGTFESLKSHMRQKHSGVAYPAEDQLVSCQQLRTGSNNNMIRIEDAPDTAFHFTTADIVDQALALMNAPLSISVQPSNDPREFCPWLRQVRWQDLCLGKDVAALVALVAHPKNEEFPSLSDGLLVLLPLASSKIDSTSELILQRLNTPKPIDE